MAYFHTNVLDPQIKALPTVSTASGSVATFDTDMTENLIEVVCDIQYSQASGTPTPSDPLPITTYTSLNLSHSGADTSNPTVYNIPFGQTVAKGTLNVTTGVLEIDKAMSLISDLNWTYDSANSRFNTQDLRGIIENAQSTTTPLDGLTCECYVNDVSSSSRQIDLSIAVNTSGVMFLKDTNYNNAPSLLSAVGNYKIVYPLATPLTIQLSATQITALLNENNIWCDTGDTEVKYLLTVGKKIS